MADQHKLFDTTPARTAQMADYLDVLPRGVVPTATYILERGQNLLILRHQKERVPVAQARIWALLPRYGVIDAPGSITVCVVNRASPDVRLCQIYDHLGAHEHAWTKTEFKAWVREWWEGAE